MNTTVDASGWMLQITQGPSLIREFQLDTEKTYILGRREHSGGWKPDIDLFPDTAVSRRHLRLSFEDGAWQIEDIGSSGGTRIDGSEMNAGDPPCRVMAGTTVQIGDTTWMMSPSDICAAQWNELSIEFRAVPVVTYGLHHCNVPIISHVKLVNKGDDDLEPFTLSFAIPGYSDPHLFECEGISKGDIQEIAAVPLRFHYEKLEGQTGKKRAELLASVDGNVVLRKDTEILGFYEWPIHTAYRKSLACFVQPAHPVVGDIAAEATAYLDGQGLATSFSDLLRSGHSHRAALAFSAIYETLRDRYDIRYSSATPGSGIRSQTIRPPHGIITHQKTRRGAGTCLDLAILIAAVLEHVSLQPVIFILRLNEWSFHALVGCWRDITPRVEPVIKDQDRLLNHVQNGKLLPIEVTGLTDRFIKDRHGKLTFFEATEMAADQLRNEQLLFALDVAAARQTVAPLHMPLNPDALSVVRSAELIAHYEGAGKLETRHLVRALITQGHDEILGIIRKAGGDPSQMTGEIGADIRVPDSTPRATVNYRRCLEDAKIAAADVGVIFVGQEHLLYAVLQSQSSAVEKLLQDLGSDRQAVRGAFELHYLWTASLIETHYD